MRRLKLEKNGKIAMTVASPYGLAPGGGSCREFFKFYRKEDEHVLETPNGIYLISSPSIGPEEWVVLDAVPQGFDRSEPRIDLVPVSLEGGIEFDL